MNSRIIDDDMEVQDIAYNKGMTLITDHQEIVTILESIGLADHADEFGCLFVRVGDGEYLDIYGCAPCVPYNRAKLYTFVL